MSIFNSKKEQEAAETAAAAAAPEQPTELIQDSVFREPPALNAQTSEKSYVNAIEEPQLVVPVTSNVATHLMAYPLVKETVDFIDSIPGVKAIKDTTTSITDPSITFIASQPVIKPVVETVDHLANQTLDTVDNVVPFIQSTTYSSLGSAFQKPFLNAVNIISKTTQATSDTIENNVILPTKNGVHEFRAFYNKKIYDTKGKPLLRSSLDPIFRPVNGAIDEFTEKNFEPTENPVSKHYSSEIERNLWLSLDLAQRSIPIVQNKATEVIMIPCNYSHHALDVFNENLENQKKKNNNNNNSINSSIAATYNSSVDLIEEAWASTVDLWNHVFGKEAHETNEPVEVIAASTVDAPIEARTGVSTSIGTN